MCLDLVVDGLNYLGPHSCEPPDLNEHGHGCQEDNLKIGGPSELIAYEVKLAFAIKIVRFCLFIYLFKFLTACKDRTKSSYG